jgi:hypothetical protein
MGGFNGRGQLMAEFKEVTLVGGEKMTINMDEIRTMQRIGGSTTVYFDHTHVVHVEETPNDILMKNGLPSR